MSRIMRFDHVGVTVQDLDQVTAFFVGLGLEVEGRTFVEGEFIDTVIAIPDSRTEIVMLRTPDGGTGVELSSFVRPDPEPGSHLSLRVTDVPLSAQLGVARELTAVFEPARQDADELGVPAAPAAES